MSMNLTAAWLEARIAPSMLSFSGTLNGASAWLSTGGAAGDGVPLPWGGRLAHIAVYDDQSLAIQSEGVDININAGDRLAVYGTFKSELGEFDLQVRVNGAGTGPVLTVLNGSMVHATLGLLLKEES